MSDLGNKEIFAKNLDYYMRLNNKDRNEIAKDLNIPYTTVTSWLNAEFYPRIDKIQLLANYFGIQKSDLVENKYIKTATLTTRLFPVLGTVKAGYNFLAQENFIGYLTLGKDVSDPDNYFGLKVTGNSMEPVMYENDLIVVHQQPDVESGKVAIVLIGDEEATVKKVIKHDGYIELVAFNSYYPPRKLYKDYRIIGRVVEARISKIFE